MLEPICSLFLSGLLPNNPYVIIVFPPFFFLGWKYAYSLIVYCPKKQAKCKEQQRHLIQNQKILFPDFSIPPTPFYLFLMFFFFVRMVFYLFISS